MHATIQHYCDSTELMKKAFSSKITQQQSPSVTDKILHTTVYADSNFITINQAINYNCGLSYLLTNNSTVAADI